MKTFLKVTKVTKGLLPTKILRMESGKKKVFNDPVHGSIELDPLCVRIIDTPQFQRLRYLKQLGACYFVYPGATHNRFEHCIGVCHLAGLFVCSLTDGRQELGITPEEVLSVKIAGLCHDLGHGPFSHTFDGSFLPRVRQGKEEWKHEKGSKVMLKKIIEENDDLKEQFKKLNVELIEDLMEGKNEKEPISDKMKGKEFLYEIVANKRTGIDVDKWDYFARDCLGLGMKNNFDHLRCMKFSKVIVDKDTGKSTICFRDKEVDTLYSMFSIRASLHRRAYQHRVTVAIDEMITDVFEKANKEKIVKGKNGEFRTISECIDDPVAFTNLNDGIFHVIMMSSNSKLEKSREILDRLFQRKLYRYIGEAVPSTKEDGLNANNFQDDIASKLPKDLQEDIFVREMFAQQY